MWAGRDSGRLNVDMGKLRPGLSPEIVDVFAKVHIFNFCSPAKNFLEKHFYLQCTPHWQTLTLMHDVTSTFNLMHTYQAHLKDSQMHGYFSILIDIYEDLY